MLACHSFLRLSVPRIRLQAQFIRRNDVQVSGLFSGVSSPIVGGAVETGVNYLVYSTVLQHLSDNVKSEDELQTSLAIEHQASLEIKQTTTPYEETNPPEPALRHVAIAAAASGFALSFILSPTELVKCRMQVHPNYYKTPLRCLRLTISSEGARGLLRGLPATLAREVPGNALFFTTYEVCKRALIPSKPPPPHPGLDTDAVPSSATLTASDSASTLREFLGTVTAGGIAGCAMWATVLPIDAAKTRIQAEFRGGRHDASLAAVMRAMWREGGLRCWWGGLTPTLLRAFPANAAQWMAWEAAQRMLR